MSLSYQQAILDGNSLTFKSFKCSKCQNRKDITLILPSTQNYNQTTIFQTNCCNEPVNLHIAVNGSAKCISDHLIPYDWWINP